MEFAPRKRLQLFAGRSNPQLASEVADHLNLRLGEPNLVDFASGETRCTFGESIRGSDVFIMQTHSYPVNDHIMEQLIMIDAAKRASAKRITAVCPIYGYARQDRKASGREPITAKLLADMLTVAGADRVVSVDLHSGQIQGFFDIPLDHLTAMPVLVEHLRYAVGPGCVIVSPDSGRVKVAERFAKHLDADVASIYKRRSKSAVNQSDAIDIMGDVAGRVCVLVDDMVDTAGTICGAADLLKKAVTCFTNNLERMDYAARGREHQPIGSGVTEAACGLIIKDRMCGRGMRWSLRMAQHIITLRSIISTTAQCWQNFWKTNFTSPMT